MLLPHPLFLVASRWPAWRDGNGKQRILAYQGHRQQQLLAIALPQLACQQLALALMLTGKRQLATSHGGWHLWHHLSLFDWMEGSPLCPTSNSHSRRE